MKRLLLRPPRSRLLLLTSLAVGAVWLALTAVSIGVYPSPWKDEIIWSAAAVHFLRFGNFGVDILPDRFGLAVNSVATPRLFTLLLAATFRIFGIGFLQARAAVAGAALAGGVLLGLAVRKLYSPWQGLAAAALFLFSWNVFFAAHFVRPEIVGITGGLLCFHLFLRWRARASSRWPFVLGLLNAAFLDIHLSYVHILIAVGAVVVVDLARRRDWRALFWFALGHAVGVLYWLAIHFLPDPALALAQLQGGNASGVIAPGGFGLLAQLRIAVQQFRDQYVTNTRLSPLQFVIFLVAILVTARQARRHWLVLVPIASLGLTLFVLLPRPAHTAYLVTLSPWLAALVAIAGGMTPPPAPPRIGEGGFSQSLRRFAPIVVVIALLTAYGVGDVVLYWNNRTLDYPGLALRLQRRVPPRANVFADSIWYFAFHEGRFSDAIHLENFRLTTAAEAAQQVGAYFAEREVEYVLVTENAPAKHLHDVRTAAAYQEFVRTTCDFIAVESGDLFGADLAAGYREMRVAVYDCRVH